MFLNHYKFLKNERIRVLKNLSWMFCWDFMCYKHQKQIPYDLVFVLSLVSELLKYMSDIYLTLHYYTSFLDWKDMIYLTSYVHYIDHTKMNIHCS